MSREDATLLRRTKYPHTHNADGTRLLEPCSGHLQVVLIDGKVCTECDECACGWRFQFVSLAKPS